MAKRIVRSDERGLYIMGHYGEKCRPTGPSKALPGEKHECSFSSGFTSSVAWLKTGLKVAPWFDGSEEWVDEDTLECAKRARKA